MTKPTPVSKPDTTSTTTPAEAAPPAKGNGTPAATAPQDPDANEATEPTQPGKRPLTVMISDRTYRHLRMLAASEGSSVSAVVIEAVEVSIAGKLRAALASLAKDLG